MRRTVIIVLMGSVLAACSAKVPVSNTHPHQQQTRGWIDPPQVGAAPGAPRPAGLD
jgi:type IV pilus biogenesis protein CpaD/CtpE